MTTPDNENKVDGVAKALHRHDADKNRDFDWFGYRKIMYGDGPALWEHLHEDAKDIFREQARVAIAAMRVPTAAMMQAGCASNPPCQYHANTKLSEIIGAEWQAMIDEALAEK